jgi:anti-sigma factor RsiW
MTCNRIATDLDAFLDGDLSRAAAEVLERHLAGCAPCQATLRRAQALCATVRAQSVPGPSEGFFERALAEATKPRPRGRQSARIVAAGFLGAFAATILTVIITGLWVGAPRSRVSDATPEVAMSLHETKTVNLVFAAKNALGDVVMSVELPPGVELAGHAAARSVEWKTQLSAGNNVLPLALVAVDGRGGKLVARLKHGDEEKVFVVDLKVGQQNRQGVTL